MTCSEETLLVALGFDSSSTNTTKDYKALVRTWLQDEGAHVEVVELCRDVLFMEWSLYNAFDYHIWDTLLRHMSTNGFHYSLFQTLVSIRSAQFFGTLCNNKILLGSFIDCYNTILNDMAGQLDANHHVGGGAKCGFMMSKYVVSADEMTDNMGMLDDIVSTITQSQPLGSLLLTHCDGDNASSFSSQLLEHSCKMLTCACSHTVDVVRRVCQLYNTYFLTPAFFRAAKLNQSSYNIVIQAMFTTACSNTGESIDQVVWNLFKYCVLSIQGQFTSFFEALAPLFLSEKSKLLDILLSQSRFAWKESLDDQRYPFSLYNYSTTQ